VISALITNGAPRFGLETTVPIIKTVRSPGGHGQTRPLEIKDRRSVRPSSNPRRKRGHENKLRARADSTPILGISRRHHETCFLHIFALLFAAAGLVIAAPAEIIVHPVPEGIPHNDDFTVKVALPEGEWQAVRSIG